MLIVRHDPEDAFARVPQVAAQTDPVLKEFDFSGTGDTCVFLLLSLFLELRGL